MFSWRWPSSSPPSACRPFSFSLCSLPRELSPRPSIVRSRCRSLKTSLAANLPSMRILPIAKRENHPRRQPYVVLMSLQKRRAVVVHLNRPHRPAPRKLQIQSAACPEREPILRILLPYRRQIQIQPRSPRQKFRKWIEHAKPRTVIKPRANVVPIHSRVALRDRTVLPVSISINLQPIRNVERQRSIYSVCVWPSLTRPKIRERVPSAQFQRHSSLYAWSLRRRRRRHARRRAYC